MEEARKEKKRLIAATNEEAKAMEQERTFLLNLQRKLVRNEANCLARSRKTNSY